MQHTKRLKNLVHFTLALIFVPTSLVAQGVEIPPQVRAAAEMITADRLMRDVEYLASDELRGRLTPSTGLDSAVAFVVRHLQRFGVKPMGDNGGYRQTYSVQEQAADTTATYMEIGGRRFPYGETFIINRFLPTDITAEVVYVGHGFYAPTLGVDAYAGVDVKGKILLVHGPGIVPEGIRSGRLTGEVSPALWEASKRGALAIVYAAPPRLLGNWNRLRRANLSRIELDPPVPSAYASAPTPAVIPQPEVIEALLAAETVKAAQLFPEGTDRNYPAPFILRNKLTLNIPSAANRLHRPSNIVAMIEGTDPLLRNEFITIAAHLDGAVGREVVNGDSIYNAADDNATGSAALLAMAEAFQQGPRPRRSVILLWDSGEEVGLWGTRWFVHQPPIPLDRIVAHFNIDMIGGTRVPGSNVPGEEELMGPNEVLLVGPRVLSLAADSLLVQTNRAYLNMTLNRLYDDVGSEFFYPRTDAGPFLERGVLTIGFFTGLHPRYHQPSDETKYLDPVKMEVVARTAFVSAWMVADSPKRVQIDKGIPTTVPRHR